MLPLRIMYVLLCRRCHHYHFFKVLLLHEHPLFIHFLWIVISYCTSTILYSFYMSPIFSSTSFSSTTLHSTILFRTIQIMCIWWNYLKAHLIYIYTEKRRRRGRKWNQLIENANAIHPFTLYTRPVIQFS